MNVFYRTAAVFIFFASIAWASDSALLLRAHEAFGATDGRRIMALIDSIEALGYPVRPFENKVREGIAKKKTAKEVMQALVWKKECAIRAVDFGQGYSFEQRLLKEQIHSMEAPPWPALVENSADQGKPNTKSPATSRGSHPSPFPMRSAEQRLERQAAQKQEMLLKKMEKEQERLNRKLEKASSRVK